MIAKVLKMIAVPIHDGEGLMADGVVTVQGKFALRMQNTSHRMLECKICMSMDNLWKEKTTISHWGVSWSAGEWGHLDSLMHGDPCTLVFVADTELKAVALPSVSCHCWCTSRRQKLQAAISILETEPLCCFPGGGTAPIHAEKECFMLRCSVPWEDQVEYDPEILPSLCFTITVKIWSGEAAVKLLISTLMTTSAFLRFHFDLHGPAESAVKL